LLHIKAGGYGNVHGETAGGFKMTDTLALCIAYLLDLIIGDPRWMPHPVQGIGRAIEKLEHVFRRVFLGIEEQKVSVTETEDEDTSDEDQPEPFRINLQEFVPSSLLKGKELTNDMQEKIAGGLLVAVITVSTLLLFSIVSRSLLTLTFHPVAQYIGYALFVYLVATTIATRGLLKSGAGVVRELLKGDIGSSRMKLSMIVGRDTESLKEKGILKATIETLAENASDAIVAPLFYFVIGGLPLAMTYKAINTLDSMVGYKNAQYKHFGWASAKLDDIANYIPARITGMLIVGAAYFINNIRYVISRGAVKFGNAGRGAGKYIARVLNWLDRKTSRPDFDSAHSAYKIMRRDGKKHSSPNSGIPEAAMAGALGVRLGGPSAYGGVVNKKPYLGEERQGPEQREQNTGVSYIKAAVEALSLTKLTSFFAFIAAILFV
jgi:adenosylcobinamide-phosphate synthase